MKIQTIRESIIENLPINEGKKNILNRRFNKLEKDPRGFLKDSYVKRSKQLLSRMPIKYKGKNNYTVVSAVYNVEKYLDDYFNSLVDQSLSFKKNIQLILVDDGSTDNSADIIKKWQKKYPNNIKYVYKENGGQASARNLGINYVENEWVTFIDPDDFVDLNYFQKVDLYINDDPEISLISCPFVFYFEDKNEFKNSHPLKYRFSNKARSYKLSELEKHIQLSVNSAFFRISNIKINDVKFNENIKPNFEDAKFVGDYTIRIGEESKVAFLSGTSYFYRKRSDGTSTLDSSWTKPSLYSDVLSKGCLELFQEANSKFGYIPKYLQRTVLYHISWYFKYLVNKNEMLSILDENQKEFFLSVLHEIFFYIEEETILNFELVGTWFFQRVALLGFFKKQKPPFQISYIKNIDKEKRQFLISYFTYFDVIRSFKLNGKDIIPKYETNINYSFVNRLFVKEIYCWIPFEKENDLFTLEIDNKPARITLENKQYHKGVRIKEILKSYQQPDIYSTDGSWLLMDRDTQADDNAEHFYRYLMNNHPSQKCYFALRKQSTDWQRLHEEGFNLVDFGSEDFEYKLRKVSKIISSHLDNYISNYFGDDYSYSKSFIFLQHGIIKDDLSAWLNTKRNLSCICTTTRAEYDSIVGYNTNYKFTEKEVVLSGLPRHDSLLKDDTEASKIILVMPTWRQSIVGGNSGLGNSRLFNHDFMKTSYAQHWYNFIHSQDLKKMAKENDFQIIFSPHANIIPYIEMFDIPDYIDIIDLDSSAISIQELFKKSKILITDYSSVSFDMALLYKTTIYYQFDKSEIFLGNHIYQSGYFSYERDGFGPVVTQEDKLLLELEKLLKNEGNTLEPYMTRMQNTFEYHDTNNCNRVYRAILDLDKPDNSEVSVESVFDHIKQAVNYEAWDLALERIKKAIHYSGITPEQVKEILKTKENILQTGYQNEPIKLASILWDEKRLDEALEVLRRYDSTNVSDELLRLRVKLSILNNDFKLAQESQKLLLEKFNETTTIEDWKFYMQLASV